MKILLAVLLLSVSFAAQAVDVTITVSAAELLRLQVAVGEVKQLKDGSNNPRNATPAEVKTFVIERVKQFIIDVEGAKLTKAAIAAVVVPAFDPQ